MTITKRRFYEFLFVLALTTKPLYLTSSGSMQPSDFIYMGLFGTLLLSGKFRLSKIEKNWVTLFLYLIVYQLFINIISYFVCRFQGYDDIAMITRIIYYIFNFFVCLTVFQMYNLVGYKRLLQLYLVGSALSLGVCYIGVMLNWRGVGRVTGFFNNPNQLGYYAILIMTIFVIYCKEMPKKVDIMLISFCTLLNIWSLSKASIVGAAVLLICYAQISNDNEGKKSNRTVIAIIAVLGVTVLLYMFMFSNLELFSNSYYITKMRRRLMFMAYENDSNLSSGRGYGRIFEIGFFIITGVGQGAYDRFTALSGKELHSTYASILVSYGLIGFACYYDLFTKAIFSDNRKTFNLFAMSGVLLYSVTHNGIRSSILWTLLAMLLLRANVSDDVQSELI